MILSYVVAAVVDADVVVAAIVVVVFAFAIVVVVFAVVAYFQAWIMSCHWCCQSLPLSLSQNRGFSLGGRLLCNKPRRHRQDDPNLRPAPGNGSPKYFVIIIGYQLGRMAISLSSRY